MLISEIKSSDDLDKLKIAQADSGGYDPSGYIVVTDGKNAGLSRFGHCSCYGTWTALSGKDHKIIWDWKGSLKQLKKLAVNKLDPHSILGDRKASEEDYDYNHLMAVYQQVIEWFKDRKKKKS